MFVFPSGSTSYTIPNSLRLRASASAYLSRTPSTAGNTKTFTRRYLLKRGALGNYAIGSAGANSNNGTGFTFRSDDTIQIFQNNGGSTVLNKITTAVFRDSSAWYDIVIAFDTTQATAEDRVKLYVNGVRITSFGTNTIIPQNGSTYFNEAATTERLCENFGVYADGYFADICGIDGQALDPSYFGYFDPAVTTRWRPKKYTGTYGTNGFYLPFSDGTSTTTLGYDRGGVYSLNLRNSGSNIGGMTGGDGLAGAFDGSTTNMFSSSAQSASQAAGYVTVNSVGKDWGTGVTKTITAFRIAMPYDSTFLGNGASTGFKLQGSSDGSNWNDLYTNSSSGTTYGTVFTVTSGIDTTTAYRYHRAVINGNGSNSTAIAELELYEAGGYGINHWTPSNISLTAGSTYDWMLDSPSNNYPVWNPLVTGATYTNGNLSAVSTSNAFPYSVESTIKTPPTGKWYAEATVSGLGANNPAVGLGNNFPDQFSMYRINGTYITSGMGASSSGTPSTYTTNDIVGIAYDADAGTLTFYKNGTAQSGGITGVTPGSYSIAFRKDSTSGDAFILNAGQRPFAYTPPTGFKALCTANLPAPTGAAADPKKHFDAILFTGTGSVQTVSGVGFQPDFVWQKTRSIANNSQLYDSVRGTTKALYANLTSAETTDPGVSAFNADGFTTTENSGYSDVAWTWKAGGSAVTNATGSITSQVSANVDAGFSIVTWTGIAGGIGHTIGHGLGATPKFIIVKGRDAGITGTDHWAVYHAITGGGQYILLSASNAAAAGTNYWNSSNPTSTVFSVAGNSANVSNELGKRYVAYCFAEVPGFSKFGSYVGNASADGPFVYCGFRPRYVMAKAINSASSWWVYDTARDTYNAMNNLLRVDLSNAEVAQGWPDFVSNGFKIRNTGMNSSGETYIFAAFAELPFQFANAR